MIWDEFLRHFCFCDEEDSGLSDEEQERKGPKNHPKHTRKRIHQAKKNFLEKFKTASKFAFYTSLAKSVLLHFARKLCWIRTSSTCRITCGCLSYNYGVRWLMNSVNNPCRGRMLTFRNCFEKNQPEFCILQIFDPPLQRNYERKRFVILIGGQIICRIR